MKRGIEVIIHILFWCLTFLFISRVFGIESVEILDTGTIEKKMVTYNEVFIKSTIICFFFSILLVYSNIYWLMHRFFFDNQLKSYLFRLLIIISVLIILMIFINRNLIYQLQEFNGGWGYPGLGIHAGIILFFLAISFTYAFTREHQKKVKDQILLKREILQSELNFLKSQINPHFLFNTLNNLYSMAQEKGHEDLSTGIEELSNLMRYMLKGSSSANVPLENEIRFIESYIQIQQLRIAEEDDFILDYKKEGNFTNARIAPLLLIPFVENAFKHGISQESKSIISIDIKLTGRNLKFMVKNKIFRELRMPDQETGIGLQNVRRRLQLLYPQKHTLEVQESNSQYIVFLNIKLDDQH